MAARKQQIRKFTRPQILFHWVYASAWLVLVLTGMTFLWRPDPHSPAVGLGAFLQGSVGQWLRLVHRVAAVALMAAPFLWLALEPRRVLAELRELMVIRGNDIKYLLVAPLHYTFGRPPLPPQGKYNGGHKLNFWIVVLTFLGFVVSGITMWFFRGVVPAETFRLMLLIHNFCFWLGLGMGILHIYLTVFHPFTRQALSAMISGFVDLKYATAEHAEWVEQQLRSGQAEVREVPAASGGSD
ncbi:MAG: cytochrome b/b6 domain-containing protein [Bacillota bacterium]|nr:MAG: hypothetical protein DIU70_04735 [Bacillota bacterium]